MHATESIQGTVRQTRWGRDTPPQTDPYSVGHPPRQRSASEREGYMHEEGSAHGRTKALGQQRSRTIVVHDLIAHGKELFGLEGFGEEVRNVVYGCYIGDSEATVFY